jgi:hypothetical protein
MPSRSVRRRQHKRIARFQDLTDQQKQAEARRLLQAWRREAQRRAEDLNAPPVWALVSAATVRGVIAAVEPSGELQADLEWVCTEAVAAVAGRHLITGSRVDPERIENGERAVEGKSAR